MAELDLAGLPYVVPPQTTWEDVDEHRVSRWIKPLELGEVTDAVLLAAPFTSGNTKPTRSWAAPDAIRAAFADYTTYSADYDVDLVDLVVRDAGDVLVNAVSPEDSLSRIENAVVQLLTMHPPFVPVVLGGDHSITAATVRGYCKARPKERVGLIYFDAHTDVRATQEGVALAGSPVRSILETCPNVSGQNVVEIGIHGFMNAIAHRRWAEDRGLKLFSAREVRKRGIDEVLAEALSIADAGTDAIYVSVDLDVLGQTDAIGAGGRISPEGLAVVDLLDAVFSLGESPKVKMLDVVELDPARDSAGITTRIAASVVLTFLGGLVFRRRVEN